MRQRLIAAIILYAATAIMVATAWYIWAGIPYALIALSFATGLGAFFVALSSGDFR
jgi:hypothetical protein